MPFYFEKHYNYVNDVFPQFIQPSQKIIPLSENPTLENNNFSKFFKLLINNFLNKKANMELISNNIQKIFQNTKKLKNEQNIYESFVYKLSKFLWKLTLVELSISKLPITQINYFMIVKIMKGIFKLQETHLNIRKELNFLLNGIKYYCLVLLPLHLIEDEFCETIESKKIFNLLTIVLSGSIDFQNLILFEGHD